MKKSVALLVSIFAAAICNVSAEQLFQAKTGQTITTKISSKELTRIQVSGFRIAKAFTNSPLTITKDKITGQIYIVPVDLTPFNLYVLDTNGDTFNLNLIPDKHALGDSIVIMPDPAALKRAKQDEIANTKASLNTPYSRQINELIQQMYLGGAAERLNGANGTEVTSTNVEIPMWKNILVIEKLRYSNQMLYGKVLTITNNTKGRVELRESQFYNKGVLAIAIDNPILNTGETARVFIVQENTTGG